LGAEVKINLLGNNSLVSGGSARYAPVESRLYTPSADIRFDASMENIIKRWQNAFDEYADHPTRIRDDKQIKELTRSLDSRAVEFFIHLARHYGSTEEFRVIMRDFNALADHTAILEYLGRTSSRGTINLKDPATFWEFVYWREKLAEYRDNARKLGAQDPAAEALKRVGEQIERRVILRDEVGDLMPEGRFDINKANHVRLLMRVCAENMPVNAVERFLIQANRTIDCLAGRGIPVSRPIAPQVDVASASGLSYLYKWTDRTFSWEANGLNTGRMFTIISAILRDQYAGTSAQARAPPAPERGRRFQHGDFAFPTPSGL
jgi:hypothetical protein